MKKLSIVLFAALLPLFTAVAQNAVGDWMIHTSFVGDNVKNVVEGRHWVYYLSAGNLFRLDKETAENESLSKVNYLSDMAINQIYYNCDKDYLVVVYDNSNIDIILSDGSVVNMPEIKDAVMTYGKTINDVTFADGLMYLATEFGYVVVDDKHFVVKESHLYGKSLTSVAEVGDMLLLSSKDAAYYGAADEYHEKLSSFKEASLSKNCRLFPISENTFYMLTTKVRLVTMTVDESGKAHFGSDMIIEDSCTLVQKAYGGFLLNVKKGKYYTTDTDGRNAVSTDAHGELCSCHPAGDGTVWAIGPMGLHMLGEAGGYYLPNALNFKVPFWMTYNKEQGLLYVSTSANNAVFDKISYPSQVNTYDGIVWKDVTPDGAPADGSYWIEFMPSMPNTYLMSTWRNGLLKVVDNEIAMTYNTANSPMKTKIHPITSIDRNGNVWVVQSYNNDEHPAMVLPAAKAKLSEVTASDWVTPPVDGLNTGSTKRASFISTKNSSYDIKIFTTGDSKDAQKALVLWNSNGDVSSSRPPQASFTSLSDQDGQTVAWTYIRCLEEDLNGNVWMGYTEGICYFNPAKAFPASSFSVVRPKVPRNDGTGFADRLLDGIEINDIAVDGANRKWIATQSSGLFLVNSDGSQIIKKFNTTNSPLASNTIYQVCCSPNSNSVYLTTPAGVYEYFSDSSPAEPTYDNIYAYPNPVRPDFMGDVTIRGLMDNSLVKIADASGNVIRQLKSTGGMVTWDCCNEQGERVKTGVYFVLCSQANGSGEGVVTKIAFIR